MGYTPHTGTVNDLCSADLTARRLVLEISQALIRTSSRVAVSVDGEKGLRTIRVRTDADGMSRLVGAQGRTVRAIRTILTALAGKTEVVYALDIAEHQ